MTRLSEPLYFLFFYFALECALLPTRFLSGYRLEKKYALSKQTVGAWFADYLKGLLMGVVLFFVSASFFYSSLSRWPDDWWWILTLVIFLFSAFLSAVFPVWIMPLFYRSTRLEDPELESRCQETLKRCGLPRMPILKIHLGQKTVKANAALVGFGPTRRIVLGDTLLSGYTPDEIQMVTAHEVGHHIRRHVIRSLVLESALSAAGLFILFRAIPPEILSDPHALPILMLLVLAAGLLVMPARNSLSRAHEREADRFALKLYPEEAVFTSLMEKLSRNNLANPEPSRWEEFLLYSHPSKKNRVRAAQNFLKFLAKSKNEA